MLSAANGCVPQLLLHLLISIGLSNGSKDTQIMCACIGKTLIFPIFVGYPKVTGGETIAIETNKREKERQRNRYAVADTFCT